MAECFDQQALVVDDDSDPFGIYEHYYEEQYLTAQDMRAPMLPGPAELTAMEDAEDDVEIAAVPGGMRM